MLGSCSKEVGSGDEQEGYGNVTLNVRTGTMSRSGAEDGDEMNNLRIWLADGEGEIRYCKFLTPDEGTNSETVEFKDVKRGVYTLYVAANTTALDAYTEGQTADADFTGKMLDTIKDGSAPDFSEGGMPLSVVKTISVGPGDNPISASLKRCAGKISITIRNSIGPGSAVFVAGVGLSRSNPSLGYLFPQPDGSIPAGAEDTGFPELAEDELYKVEYGSPVKVYETFLYETSVSEQDGRFTFNLFAAIYNSAVQPSEVKFNLVDGIRRFSGAEYEIPRGDRSISYIDKYGNSQTLKQISRNEHISIVVNIFYNRELGDFEYCIEGWEKKDNETTFD